MSISSRGTRLGGVALCLVAMQCISACNGEQKVAAVYSPEELRGLLNSAGGWTPLPIPDSSYRIGSIIQVNEDGIRWIGSLESCRFPMGDFSETGQIPGVSFTKGVNFSANVLLNYKGISAGPEFNRVKSVVLEVADQSAEKLDLIKLQVWQELPSNRDSVSEICFNELKLEDRYVITEAFTVSKANYTLLTDNGAKIELSAPVIGSFIDASVGADVSVTTDGKLSVVRPTVFGIRKALRINNRFEVLGDTADEPETADEKIAEFFLRTNSP